MHEWLTDNGQTPHIVVNAGSPGVDVLAQYVEAGRIILNIGYPATRNLKLGNEEISFGARFGGVSTEVRVPVAAVPRNVRPASAHEERPSGRLANACTTPRTQLAPA